MSATDQPFLVYLTNGDRGHVEIDALYAGSSAEAKTMAERLNPGMRVFGVQLRLDAD